MAKLNIKIFENIARIAVEGMTVDNFKAVNTYENAATILYGDKEKKDPIYKLAYSTEGSSISRYGATLTSDKDAQDLKIIVEIPQGENKVDYVKSLCRELGNVQKILDQIDTAFGTVAEMQQKVEGMISVVEE